MESLTKEFFTHFKKPLADLQSKNPPLTETEIAEKFEEMKKEFFYEINTQGEYHILKAVSYTHLTLPTICSV